MSGPKRQRSPAKPGPPRGVAPIVHAIIVGMAVRPRLPLPSETLAISGQRQARKEGKASRIALEARGGVLVVRDFAEGSKEIITAIEVIGSRGPGLPERDTPGNGIGE
jgi:hypothetical protein